MQHFMIEYRPRRGAEWRLFADKRGEQIFEANSDTTTSAVTALEPPVAADAVRLLPFSVHPRVVCLRAELRGCKDERKTQSSIGEKDNKCDTHSTHPLGPVLAALLATAK